MAYQTPHPDSPAATITSLSDDDKRHILSYLPPDVKLLAVAPARIYQAPFNASPDSWTFTGLRGMLVFGRNRVTVFPDRPLGVGEGTSIEQNYWFRLIDVDSGKGIVWFHPIPSGLDYHSDKPFFHTFSGCSRMFGFRFDEDDDAEKFRRRVTRRIQISAPRFSKPRATKPVSVTSPPAALAPLTHAVSAAPAGAGRRVSPGMISAPTPGTFMHVAHVGLDAKGQIESTPNIEPGWTMIVEELQGYGVTEKMVDEDFDFVEGFLAGAKASLVQELRKTTPAAAKITRMPTLIECEKKSRPVQRKKVPFYF
ncbi:hypothetical protein OH76DRAFT_1257771 [Lentinus brumalis]|uniref:WH1-domain-containing protein n=1 Tax=Lentinus brumalis TaxID=2498619 RepID=A0A371CRC4_9APHY|nr:hypothetical protein OH76DRAFT_1257771 [Polyporus brumalis]